MQFLLNQKNNILEWAKGNGLKVDLEKHNMIKAYNDATNEFEDIEISEREVLEAATQVDDATSFSDLKLIVGSNPNKVKYKTVDLLCMNRIVAEREIRKVGSEHKKVLVEYIYEHYYETMEKGLSVFLSRAPRSAYTYVLDRRNRKAYFVYLVEEVEKLMQETERFAEKKYKEYCKLLNKDAEEKAKFLNAKDAYRDFNKIMYETQSDANFYSNNAIELKAMI